MSIEFRYDFTPEEWHEWNNQACVQMWRKCLTAYSAYILTRRLLNNQGSYDKFLIDNPEFNAAVAE